MENVQVKSSSTDRKALKWFKNLTREIPGQFPIRVKDFTKQTKWLEDDWKFKTIKKSSGLELEDSQPSNPGIVIRPKRLTNDPIHIEITEHGRAFGYSISNTAGNHDHCLAPALKCIQGFYDEHRDSEGIIKENINGQPMDVGVHEFHSENFSGNYTLIMWVAEFKLAKLGELFAKFYPEAEETKKLFKI